MKKLIFISLLLPITQIFAGLGEAPDSAVSSYVCTVDERTEMTKFLCLDKITGERFDQDVEPIEAMDAMATLRDNGVEFITSDQPNYTVLLAQFFPGFDPTRACFQQIQFTIEEFNRLGQSSPHIRRAQAVATALKNAGVCSQTIRRDNTNLGLQITNHDQLLQHFLCVSNHESTFGRGTDNLGRGGRGPFGINPIHVRNSGGICDDLTRAVLPDTGDRTERGARYENATVREQNARCALRLYNANGYRDWGTSTTSWGTNRHCSARLRARYNFERNLGAAACCSQTCRDRVARAQGRQNI